MKQMEAAEARAVRTRRLVELGGLVEIAGLQEITADNRPMILGALLEIVAAGRASTAKRSQWLTAGAAEFRRRKLAKESSKADQAKTEEAS